MTFNADTWWVVGIIVTALIGAVTFLIKTAVFNRVDKCEKKVELCVLRDEHEKDIAVCTEEIKQIRQDYTPRSLHSKDIDECRIDIKQIKAEVMTKEDFFREMNKFERKMDRQDEKIDRLLTIILKERGISSD